MLLTLIIAAKIVITKRKEEAQLKVLEEKQSKNELGFHSHESSEEKEDICEICHPDSLACERVSAEEYEY